MGAANLALALISAVLTAVVGLWVARAVEACRDIQRMSLSTDQVVKNLRDELATQSIRMRAMQESINQALISQQLKEKLLGL